MFRLLHSDGIRSKSSERAFKAMLNSYFPVSPSVFLNPLCMFDKSPQIEPTHPNFPVIRRPCHVHYHELPAAAGDLVPRALAKRLSTSLSMPGEDIQVDKPIHAYGVDSLFAVEIRYWLLKEMKAELAVFEILGSKSISQLRVLAAQKSEFLQASCIDRAQ